MQIREAEEADFEQIWPIFREIAGAGDTYAYPHDIAKDEAQRLWMDLPRKTFVAVSNDAVNDDAVNDVSVNGESILGTYYIKTNQMGPGSHVCNCGYMVGSGFRGRGVATAMCEHSQQIALDLGYKAMQFNFVASTNEGAVKLWQKLGFDVVGRLPRAFRHPGQGYVDALVMYKWLVKER